MTENTDFATNEWQTVRIGRRRIESENIISLELVARDGRLLAPFKAGAHVDVKIAPGIVRQYSLLNDPCEQHRYRLGILLDKASRGGSSAIHSTFVPGLECEVSLPRNHFPLTGTEDSVLLFAGGVGVTPIMAMARELHSRQTPFELHYCFRTPSCGAFVEELLASEFGDCVEIHIDTGPEEQRLDLRKLLAMPNEGRHIYICGPGGFIDHIVRAAVFANWPEDQIHLERFAAQPLSNDEFTVVAARSGVEVKVCAGQRISEALRAAGIEVEMSCEAGVCGTCYTHVLEGTPDHKDTFQTATERAKNDGIAICCSGSRSSRLVLDI